MGKCSLTGKRANAANNVSKSYNHTRKWQRANVQTKRIFDEELNRFVKVRLSMHALRSINKMGLSAYLRKKELKLSDIAK